MTVREKFIGPYLRIAPWVAEHPTAKRFPAGFNSNRGLDCRGLDVLEVFCGGLLALQENYSPLFEESDDATFKPCLDLWALRDN